MPAVPKPNHGRNKRRRGDRTKITPAVRKHVKVRSGGYCEWCGDYVDGRGGQMAHMESAGQIGRGDVPWNIMLLCGPSTNTGTCHNYADFTEAGRAERMQKRAELVVMYGVQICARPLCSEETDRVDDEGLPICEDCMELFPERGTGNRPGWKKRNPFEHGGIAT